MVNSLQFKTKRQLIAIIGHAMAWNDIAKLGLLDEYQCTIGARTVYDISAEDAVKVYRLYLLGKAMKKVDKAKKAT